MSKVDGNVKYHKSFDLAIKRIIKDSCDISAEPWGGNSRGKVFERNNFNIEYVTYIKDSDNKKVIIKSKDILAFCKDWKDGPCHLYSIYGKFKNDKNLLDRIYKSICKRWNYGWKLVEQKELK